MSITRQFHIDAARRAETQNKWGAAAEHWRAAGREDQAEACDMLKVSQEKGDRFRRRVRELTTAGVECWAALETAARERG